MKKRYWVLLVLATMIGLSLVVNHQFINTEFGSKVKKVQNDNNTLGKYVEKELLVKFKDSVSEERILEINGLIGTVELNPERRKFLKSNYLRLVIINDHSVIEVINEYKKMNEVESAKPNYIIEKQTR